VAVTRLAATGRHRSGVTSYARPQAAGARPAPTGHPAAGHLATRSPVDVGGSTGYMSTRTIRATKAAALRPWWARSSPTTRGGAGDVPALGADSATDEARVDVHANDRAVEARLRRCGGAAAAARVLVAGRVPGGAHEHDPAGLRSSVPQAAQCVAAMLAEESDPHLPRHSSECTSCGV
jgi:hypothetical protein